MGVRIEAYAVDLPRFDAFLDAPLADLLLRYQRDGIDRRQHLMFLADKHETFVVAPGGEITAAITRPSGRSHEILAADQLESIEALRRTARAHLSADSIYQSSFLLRAFSNCQGVDFIQRLIDGHRRWWIGSVLQAAVTVLSDREYVDLALLFRKILRGFDCGYLIPDDDVGFAVEGLSFTPADDPDLRFGRWDDHDCRLATDLLRRIASAERTFKRPPGPSGIAPAEFEWHDWVQENIASLLRVKDLNYEACNLLTFIG